MWFFFLYFEKKSNCDGIMKEQIRFKDTLSVDQDLMCETEVGRCLILSSVTA